jgi:hypothetical protein
VSTTCTCHSRVILRVCCGSCEASDTARTVQVNVHAELRKPAPITYYLTMYSITQMQKAEKQCKSIHAFLVLSPELEFNTIKAQILEKISKGLKLKTITFEHYSVAWTIPRTQASSMLLCSPTDYQFLLNLASNQKTPSVNLVIKAHLLKNKVYVCF